MSLIDGKALLDLISTRQSDRKYSSSPVEQDKIERITEAGRLAPSACNGQPWKFIVVNETGLVKKVAATAGAKILKMNMFVDQAPVLIVVIREKTNLSSGMGGLVKSKDYSLIDIGLAVANICLQAEAEGLGSCIIGWFDEKEVKNILGIPRSRRVELIITIGYPDTMQRLKTRKPKDDTVSYNRY